MKNSDSIKIMLCTEETKIKWRKRGRSGQIGSPIWPGLGVRNVRDKAERRHREDTIAAEQWVRHCSGYIPPGIDHIVAGELADGRRYQKREGKACSDSWQPD